MTSAPRISSEVVDASRAPALLSVRDLRVRLSTPHGELTAVDGVSFDLPPGSAMGLVGESGSGKSLLLRAILGLLPDGARLEGTMQFDGQELTELSPKQYSTLRGKRISVVFQDPMTALNPVRRVGKQIAEGPIVHEGLNRQAARARAIELLTEVGIPDASEVARKYPHELSGGMRQRVLIAMALSCDPKLILCDEPTTALDVTLQKKIIGLLQALCAERGMALLFVSHDLAVVSELCDHINVMYAGQFVETGPVRQVVTDPRHVYTWALLRSLPVMEGPKRPPLAIGGDAPDRLNPPSGCRFHPRCQVAASTCSSLPYLLKDLGGNARSSCIYGDEGLPVSTNADGVPVSAEGSLR